MDGNWRLTRAARRRCAVLSWKPGIQAGETPGEMVSRSSAFPELFSNLYNTGEISGQLDDSLRRLHHYYEEESARLLRAFIRWFLARLSPDRHGHRLPDHLL